MSAPTEPGSDEELQYLFRTAAEGFEPDNRRLTLGGAAVGRRLRRRRTVAALGSAATVAALAVTGAFVLAPAGRTAATVAPAVSASSASTPSTASTGNPVKAAVTVKEMTAAVIADLPGLQVTRGEPVTLPVAGEQPREVRFTVDDGRGPSLLTVAVRHFDSPVPATGKFGCPLSNQPGPTDECTLTTLPDGSTLRLGKTSPPGNDPHHTWEALLLTPAGLSVNVAETNMASAEDQTVTRPEPVLPMDRLRQLVTDPVWLRAAAAALSAQQDGTGAAPAGDGVPLLPGARIAAIAAPLLPAGLTAGGANGGLGDAWFSVLGGGKAGLLRIRVQDRAAADDFDTATTLPDGSRVLVVSDERVLGGVRNTVDVLRPDGRRIRLVASTSVKPDDPAGATAKPVLTVDQLTAIATSPAWKADGTKP